MRPETKEAIEQARHHGSLHNMLNNENRQFIHVRQIRFIVKCESAELQATINRRNEEIQRLMDRIVFLNNKIREISQS